MTAVREGRYRRCMAHAFLIFDFGTNEEAAQLARHRIEGWKQGFRLGNKILLKFARAEGDASASVEAGGEAKEKPAKKGNKKDEAKPEAAPVKMLVRLDFSDHEKLSLQRWLDRIPNEEPFKAAGGTVVRHGGAEFEKTEELFDELT